MNFRNICEEDTSDAWKGSIVSSILFTMTIFGFAYALILSVSKQYFNSLGDYLFQVTLVASIIFTISYILSLRRNYRIGGYIASFTSVLSTLGFAIFTTTNDFWYLLFLFFPLILFCVLFNRIWTTIFTVSLFVGSITIFMAKRSQASGVIQAIPLILLFAVSILILSRKQITGSRELRWGEDYSQQPSKERENLAQHLAGISNKIFQTQDMDTLFKTLSKEFQQMAFDFMVIQLEPETDVAYIKYNSINSRLLDTIQKISGESFGKPRKKINEYSQVIQSTFIDGKSQYFRRFFRDSKGIYSYPRAYHH